MSIIRLGIIIISLCFLQTEALSSVKNNKDTVLLKESFETLKNNIFVDRIDSLNIKSPIEFVYNQQVQLHINKYLDKERVLISRMLGLSNYYFPIFEKYLDKYNLPLEFKYLAIVESSLNPRAKSNSGATGLWQFMYLTGKQYNLNVTSYIDERQDPLKSTEAACIYLAKLYEMFGDWNLVLAAYNGGPGYIQRKIISTGEKDFWGLHQHLRKETRNYIPKFIAINYIMEYSKEHLIDTTFFNLSCFDVDTITLKDQIELGPFKEISCINEEMFNYLNPSYKTEIIPVKSKLILPKDVASDFLLNEQEYYLFLQMVSRKEILINEERIIYNVKKGDYLGKIAKRFNVHIYEIKKWNELRSTKLNIDDKLVLYIKTKKEKEKIKNKNNTNEYIVQKGDTLWGIAQKFKGLTVWKLKSINNMEDDLLKPGTKIIVPTI
mgnify:CR=1 FL=1|tara:strand:- start:393 stop:1700 length:1308 start_codon:yes stop_codon:yes gene_type:complete